MHTFLIMCILVKRFIFSVKPTTPGLNTQAPINNQQTPIQVYTPNFSPIIPYSTQVPKTTPNPIPIVPNAPSYNGRQTQTQSKWVFFITF